MPIPYNPTDSRFLAVAQARTNNGQKDVRIILDIITNDFYSLDDDGNFNIIGGGGGSQGLDSVLTIDNRSGLNNILFENSYGLSFSNASLFKEGTTDAGLGGVNGVAQICSVGYELKWEAGRLYVMQQGGTLIRQSLYNLNNVPSVNDDINKGYIFGSLWTLDDGTVYTCVDATSGAAVWIHATAQLDYTEYVAYVTQTTGNPTAVVIKNDTGYVFNFTRDTVGEYYITTTGAFPDKNKVFPVFNSQTNQGFTTILWNSINRIDIFTTDTSAILADGQFTGNLSIKIYK